MALQYNTDVDRAMRAQLLGDIGVGVGAMLPSMLKNTGRTLFGYTEDGYEGTKSQYKKDKIKEAWEKHIKPHGQQYNVAAADSGLGYDVDFTDFGNFYDVLTGGGLDFTFDSDTKLAVPDMKFGKQLRSNWTDADIETFQRGGDFYQALAEGIAPTFTGKWDDDVTHQGWLGTPGGETGKYSDFFDAGGWAARNIPKGYNMLDRVLGGALPNIGEMAYKKMRDKTVDLMKLKSEAVEKQKANADWSSTPEGIAHLERIKSLQKNVDMRQNIMQYGADPSGGPGIIESMWGPSFNPFNQFKSDDKKKKTSTPFADLYYDSKINWENKMGEVAEDPDILNHGDPMTMTTHFGDPGDPKGLLPTPYVNTYVGSGSWPGILGKAKDFFSKDTTAPTSGANTGQVAQASNVATNNDPVINLFGQGGFFPKAIDQFKSDIGQTYDDLIGDPISAMGKKLKTRRDIKANRNEIRDKMGIDDKIRGIGKDSISLTAANKLLADGIITESELKILDNNGMIDYAPKQD